MLLMDAKPFSRVEGHPMDGEAVGGAACRDLERRWQHGLRRNPTTLATLWLYKPVGSVMETWWPRSELNSDPKSEKN